MELAAVDQWINELTDMCSASSRDQLITALPLRQELLVSY